MLFVRRWESKQNRRINRKYFRGRIEETHRSPRLDKIGLAPVIRFAESFSLHDSLHYAPHIILCLKFTSPILIWEYIFERAWRINFSLEPFADAALFTRRAASAENIRVIADVSIFPRVLMLIFTKPIMTVFQARNGLKWKHRLSVSTHCWWACSPSVQTVTVLSLKRSTES